MVEFVHFLGKIKPTIFYRSAASRLPFTYLMFGDVKNNLADIASSFITLQNTALTASTIFFWSNIELI